MPLYEHVFMARQDVTSAAGRGDDRPVSRRHRENSGKVEKTEMWGVKSLAFRIKKNRKAHFTLFNLELPPRRSPRWSVKCASTRTSSAS